MTLFFVVAVGPKYKNAAGCDSVEAVAQRRRLWQNGGSEQLLHTNNATDRWIVTGNWTVIISVRKHGLTSVYFRLRS